MPAVLFWKALATPTARTWGRYANPAAHGNLGPGKSAWGPYNPSPTSRAVQAMGIAEERATKPSQAGKLILAAAVYLMQGKKAKNLFYLLGAEGNAAGYARTRPCEPPASAGRADPLPSPFRQQGFLPTALGRKGSAPKS